MISPRAHRIVMATLSIGVIALTIFAFHVWSENKELQQRNSLLPPAIYQSIKAENSFLNAEALGGEEKGRTLETIKRTLIESKKSFIEADLEELVLKLYKEGEVEHEIEIKSKGREGSWWETPTGYYTMLGKETNHFSSIGKVWMPWSIQFYGNFFIHGWPYYEDGTSVSQSYSGGCIRLSTEDAEEVFRFVTKEMPILVFDRELKPAIVRALQPKTQNPVAPSVLAEAALVSDLDTGEVLLNKNADQVLPIASLTKVMTGVVASELIYLERAIVVRPEMLTASIQSFPLKPGDRLKAFDLLYPLFMESSNGSAKALSSFLGENMFVTQMNKKANALSMTETTFTDPAGVNETNVSTLKDIAKLSKYVLEKRSFLFEVSRGKEYSGFGKSEFAKIKNFNEFVGMPNLIGMKNGESTSAKQTILTVWQFKDERSTPRSIFIGVLGSSDRKTDVERLLHWLDSNFGLK